MTEDGGAAIFGCGVVDGDDDDDDDAARTVSKSAVEDEDRNGQTVSKWRWR